eukprot:1157396-Pelagomonas_calceolata.AAC.3
MPHPRCGIEPKYPPGSSQSGTGPRSAKALLPPPVAAPPPAHPSSAHRCHPCGTSCLPQTGLDPPAPPPGAHLPRFLNPNCPSPLAAPPVHALLAPD